MAVLMLAVAAGCGSGGDDDGDGGAAPERDYEIPSLSAGELDACRGKLGSLGFRCGSIEVPFERADPSLGETTVGFAVLPPKDEAEPEGAIFAVEGGPGYSSTGTANAFTKLFGGAARHARAGARRHARDGALGAARLPRPPARPAARSAIALSTCARRLGERFESYRTAAAADDIDAVREALGYDRITLYGDSYGTFLAQSYAFRHPRQRSTRWCSTPPTRSTASRPGIRA